MINASYRFAKLCNKFLQCEIGFKRRHGRDSFDWSFCEDFTIERESNIEVNSKTVVKVDATDEVEAVVGDDRTNELRSRYVSWYNH